MQTRKFRVGSNWPVGQWLVEAGSVIQGTRQSDSEPWEWRAISGNLSGSPLQFTQPPPDVVWLD
jgi:hypothetical protein